jgi:hypothetical protein
MNAVEIEIEKAGRVDHEEGFKVISKRRLDRHRLESG